MVCSGALVLGISVSFYPLTRLFIRFLAQPAKDRVPNFELVFTEPLEFWTAYFKVFLYYWG